MNKIAICLISLVLVIACNAQSNNDKRFIGTWEGEFISYIFYSDGTYEIKGEKYSYFVNGSKLILETSSSLAGVTDYYFSSDGKILVINGFWLRKK